MKHKEQLEACPVPYTHSGATHLILRPQGLAIAHAYDRPMASQSGRAEEGIAHL